jgi:hypothetical protein
VRAFLRTITRIPAGLPDKASTPVASATRKVLLELAGLSFSNPNLPSSEHLSSRMTHGANRITVKAQG